MNNYINTQQSLLNDMSGNYVIEDINDSDNNGNNNDIYLNDNDDNNNEDIIIKQKLESYYKNDNPIVKNTKEQLLYAIHENDGYLPLSRTDNDLFYQFTRYPYRYNRNQEYLLLPYDIVGKLYISYKVIRYYLDSGLSMPDIDKNTNLYTFIIPMELIDELDYEIDYQQISINKEDYTKIMTILSS
jgi:hypothetical protein